jgi:hypothetical protein
MRGPYVSRFVRANIVEAHALPAILSFEGSQNRRQAKTPTSAVRHNNKINYWRLVTRSFPAVLMILL